MVTSVAMRNDWAMDGVTVTGQDLRLQQASAWLTGASPSGSTGIAARPGVRYGTGNPLQVNASSGMNITVNAGVAWVQGTAAANAGMYTGCLDSTATLTVATSDPTNPRIDNVIVQVTDLGTSSSTTVVVLQTGTPASSPVAPTLPANSLLLAQIAVAANASSIVAGNITDKRVYTAATGGIPVMANFSNGITGQAGQYAHSLATGRLAASDGSGNAVQPKIGQFAPVTSTLTSSTSLISPGASATILSASINTDGFTEVRIEISCYGITQTTTHATDWGEHQLLLDGTIINSGRFSWQMPAAGSGVTTGEGCGAGIFVGYVTPAAGAHTVAWKIQNAAGSTQGVQVFIPVGSPSQFYSWLRVGPAFN